jgi:serpin B
MKRRQLMAVSSGFVAAALAGCIGNDNQGDDGSDGGADGSDGNDPAESETPDETETPADVDDEHLETLVRGTNGFAFDLYGEVVGDEPAANVFASPISATLGLSMAYAGAREDTRDQMREVLGYQLDDSLVHAGFAQLQEQFDERGADGESDAEGEQPFELSVVNSAWGQSEYPFEEGYLDTLDTHYGGGLRETDFRENAPAARADINDWVATETDDRIEDLLPEGSLTPLTRLVLVNAVYFMANWKHTFPTDATSEETFTALDGDEHAVQMMEQEQDWQYAELDGAQAVELPYVGDEVSMLVVLPPEGEFESYESSFDAETLDSLVDALERQEGTVYLPRFEFDWRVRLSKPLKALGMEDAFAQKAANFDGIADTDEDLYLHEAFHKTFVAVDESGTEAAGATAAVIGDTAVPADPFEFRANRPFLFAIRDRPTGSVLFLGRAVDPEGWR